MGLLNRKADPAAVETFTEDARCNGCGATDQPLEKLPGLGLIACVDPVTCRLRAQGQGTWKRYP